MTDMVSVPKLLLAEVLDVAESNSFSTESEFAWCKEQYDAHKAQRDKIRELRKVAGIEDTNDVVGEGFFGMLKAVDEHEKKK